MLPGKFSPLTIAVLLVAAETLITGAFHLDGLADTFDAFFSTAKTPEKKLEIMKDSRIGVMGAVALVLSLLLKITLGSESSAGLTALSLLLYPAMGRLAQVALCTFSPYVRTGGIVHLFSLAGDKKTLLCCAPCFWRRFLILPGSAASLAGVACFSLSITPVCSPSYRGHHGRCARLGNRTYRNLFSLACACLLF